MEDKKYQDITKALNIKESDISVLSKLITPYVDKQDFYDMVDDDYNNGRTVNLSVSEYKAYVLMEYFIEYIFGSKIEDWLPFEGVKRDALTLYKRTFHAAETVVNSINGEEQKNIVEKETPKIKL